MAQKIANGSPGREAVSPGVSRPPYIKTIILSIVLHLFGVKG